MFENQSQINKLRQQLKNFGLNPSEWTPVAGNAKNLMFRNKLEKSFRILAQWQPREMSIVSLELVSL